MKSKIFIALAIIIAFLTAFAPILPGEIQVAVIVLAIPVIIFFHKENLEWCRKLDRIKAGDKGVKL